MVSYNCPLDMSLPSYRDDISKRYIGTICLGSCAGQDLRPRRKMTSHEAESLGGLGLAWSGGRACPLFPRLSTGSAMILETFFLMEEKHAIWVQNFRDDSTFQD